MKKYIYALMALVLMGSVSAWHCTETTFGAQGWYERYYTEAPDGCEGTGFVGVCESQCIGTTFREFGCRRYGYSERVIDWEDTPNATQCSTTGGEIPEFGTLGAVLALTGVGIFVAKRRK